MTLSRAQPIRRKEEARAYAKAMLKTVGHLNTSVENVWGFKQFVVVEYVIEGQQTGAYGWIAARKDASFKVAIVDVIELRDGKIARVWRYDNPAEILSRP